MKNLAYPDFETFFQELHGYPPYQWQVRLCQQVLSDGWPDFLTLPTGSGKTSVLEIAVFTLAVQAKLPVNERTAPTRIFFVIDRRIVVDEADRRAMFIAGRLAEPTKPITTTVAESLKHLATSDGRSPDDCMPLEAHTLRGGFYRTNSWASSLVQPMIVTSTVDQVGSRLLFRGYGVSPTARPLQAALVGTDSIIILDEAHTALPLGETVDSIRGYQSIAVTHGEASFIKPLQMVQMTATLPPEATDQSLYAEPKSVFSLDPEVDFSNEQSPMVKCYRASKRIKLDVATSAKGKKAKAALAKNLLGRVEGVVEDEALAVGVVVNRVATAKHLYDALRSSKKIKTTGAEVHLMVGRMRPIDRDSLGKELGERLRTKHTDELRLLERPIIVVATQCLEVGADLDFDHLISEAASLDALRQRFGRLNRAGRLIEATGEIVIRADQNLTEKQINALKSKSDADPVYETSLVRTFQWLHQQAGDEEGEKSVDFGLSAMDNAWSALPTRKEAASEQMCREQLLINQPERIALMPAHVDLLSQTYVHFVGNSGAEDSERKAKPGKAKLCPVTVFPDPDVGVFLHGRTRRSVDVSVCWRADLCDVTQETSCKTELHSLCPVKDELLVPAVTEAPPSSAECISVSLNVVKDFLQQERSAENDQSDASEVEADSGQSDRVQPERRPVVWRGPDHSFLCESTGDLRPGDTIVFPLSVGGWSLLGHIPSVQTDPAICNYDVTDPETRKELLSVDVGDIASLAATWKPRLRLYPLLMASDVSRIPRRAVINDDMPEETDENFLARLQQFAVGSRNKSLGRIAEWMAAQPKRWQRNDRISNAGTLLSWKGKRLDRDDLQQLLDGRSHQVTSSSDFSDETSTDSNRGVLLAHHLQSVHDRAKQTATAIGLSGEVIEQVAQAAAMHDLGKAEPRFQSVLFGGSRGEAWMRKPLLAKSKRSSKSFRERQADSDRAGLPNGFRHELLSVQLLQATESSSSDMLMHLVAAHHGHARPWLPACEDLDPTDVSLKRLGVDQVIDATDRHAGFDTQTRVEIAERFWRMQRRYGAWGTAFLESTLRMADQQVSREESEGFKQSKKMTPDLVVMQSKRETMSSISLRGLDGSNPLAFLASLGLLWLLNKDDKPDSVRMHWEVDEGAWRPVLTGPVPFDRPSLDEKLAEFTDRSLPEALSLLDEKYQDDGSFAKGAGKITPSPCRFHSVAKQMLARLFAGEVSARSCNFVPALGSEGTRKKLAGKETDSIEHSQLYMTKGSGHQRMLELMRNVHEATDLSHRTKALFAPWVYDDSGQSLNFRWDPADDRKYALRWRNPSSDPGMTVMGASDLAIESLIFFPTAIADYRLETTGFQFVPRKGTFWSWPMWTNPLSVDAIQSLLQWSELHFTNPSDTRLPQAGVAVVQRSERKRNDKYFNFSAAETV